MQETQETLVQLLGQGRSPGGGNGKPLQYSCLQNPMDRGAWLATVTGLQRVRHDWVTECMCTYTHTYMHTHTRTHTHTQSVCGIVYLSSHYGKQCEVFSKKLKTELPYDPAISLLGIYQRKTNTLIWRYSAANAHSSIIYNSQGMEAT